MIPAAVIRESFDNQSQLGACGLLEIHELFTAIHTHFDWQDENGDKCSSMLVRVWGCRYRKAYCMYFHMKMNCFGAGLHAGLMSTGAVLTTANRAMVNIISKIRCPSCLFVGYNTTHFALHRGRVWCISCCIFAVSLGNRKISHKSFWERLFANSAYRSWLFLIVVCC